MLSSQVIYLSMYVLKYSLRFIRKVIKYQLDNDVIEQRRSQNSMTTPNDASNTSAVIRKRGRRPTSQNFPAITL
jgi:hypothetical protein